MGLEALRRRAAAGEPPEALADEAARLLGGSPGAVVDEDVREMAVRVAGGTVVHGGAADADDPRTRGTRLLAGLLLALPGEGVHLITATEDVAQAEAAAARQLYGPLDVTVGVLRTDMRPAQRRAAYAADVTIGPYQVFGIDRLRDEQTPAQADRTRRDAPAAVVHDTDQVLVAAINDHLSLQLEDAPPKPAELSGAARHAARMVEGRDFTGAADKGLPRITAQGRQVLHDAFGVTRPAGVSTLLLEKQVAEALLAGSARRGEDYDLADGQVVRRASGRLPGGVHFSGGLRQAIEAREGVPVTGLWWISAVASVRTYAAGYRVLGGTAHRDLLLAGHLSELFGLRVWDRRAPALVAAERERAAELDHHLDVSRRLFRWNAAADRLRAEFLDLYARTRDPAGLAGAVRELTGRRTAEAHPALRDDLQATLLRVLLYLNTAESYEWSIHWPDGLPAHERALDEIAGSLRATLRAVAARRLEGSADS